MKKYRMPDAAAVTPAKNRKSAREAYVVTILPARSSGLELHRRLQRW
jgi:hypothetical protein